MNGKSILIVDDDQGFVQVAAAILRHKEYVVETASSGQEAVSKARESFHNVAILDISLPDIDGTELLSALVKAQPDTVAIMLTGHSSVNNAIKSLNYGATAYLEKPVDPEHLLSVINRGLERQRLVFENRHLVKELEKRNRDIEILLTVSQTVSRSLDFQTIVEAGLRQVAGQMGTEACYIYLLERDKLVLKGDYGLDGQAVETMEGYAARDRLLTRLATEGKPVVASLGRPDPDPALHLLTGEGYCCSAHLPLATAEGTMGMMGVQSKSRQDFSRDDLDLLAAIAREISIALRNSQLYEEASSVRALREIDNFRSQLLANVAHELRTPLTPIKGFAGALLMMDVDEPSRREYLKTIEREADKLNDLIEELLVGSRIEAGTLEVNREEQTLPDIVKSVSDRLTNLAAKHRLTIAVPDDLGTIEVDSTHIGRVLTNLVENAAKYSQEGTRITLEATRTNGHITTTVSDEGMGIPPEFREKVFDRFFRVGNPDARRKKGTGLGLNICRSIVKEHGGKIWVDSEPGKGSRFSFTLPAKN